MPLSSSNAFPSQSGNQVDHWHGRLSWPSGSLKDRFPFAPKEVNGRVCFGRPRVPPPEAKALDYLRRGMLTLHSLSLQSSA